MPIEEKSTGLLVNNGNQLDAIKYMSHNCYQKPVPEFVDGMGAVIQCTSEDQLILSIGPFKGKDLSKLMTFVMVWTDNIPDGIEDHIKIKHLVDGVEDTEDTMTITKSALSTSHGDALPYYFDPAKEHIIDILTTQNAIGYNLSFDYVQFNTMNINQINSALLAGNSDKPFVQVEDYASPIITFSNVNAVTVSIPFNTIFVEAPAIIAQCVSSYFTVDLDIYEDYFDLTVATSDLAVYSGDVLVNWIARGVATAPYQTKIVEYISE